MTELFHFPNNISAIEQAVSECNPELEDCSMYMPLTEQEQFENYFSAIAFIVVDLILMIMPVLFYWMFIHTFT